MTSQAISRGRSTRASQNPAGAAAPRRTDDAVLQDYQQACQDRDRWTLRRRSSARRHQDFVLALKHLAKSVANDATAQLTDRHARVAVRASVYSRLAELVTRMEEDRLDTRSRTLRWSRRLLAFSACLIVAAAALSFGPITQLL